MLNFIFRFRLNGLKVKRLRLSIKLMIQIRQTLRLSAHSTWLVTPIHLSMNCISPFISTTTLLASYHPYPALYSTRTLVLSKSQQNHRRYATSTKLFDAGDEHQHDSPYVSEFATQYHAPVMWKECIESLLGCRRAMAQMSPLLFVDGTLGGGGHSAALLQQLGAGDIVMGVDVDPDALSTASERLREYIDHDGTLKPLFIPVESNFCNMATKLPQVVHPVTSKPIISNGVDGILLDLGVSSYQIDTPTRGFAFLKDGPLDMRMNSSSGITAADILNEFSNDQIRRILKQYGDESRAKRIANAIVECRPLNTTQDLVNAVATVVPEFAKSRRLGRKATLARVFQSLRIVVNREDTVLKQTLEETCPALIRPGGRLVVLSYHSMEDRATKRVMRDGTTGARPNDERDMYGNYVGTPRPWKNVGKARTASEQEVELNSRARSATLRVAERTQDTASK